MECPCKLHSSLLNAESAIKVAIEAPTKPLSLHYMVNAKVHEFFMKNNSQVCSRIKEKTVLTLTKNLFL